MFSFSKFNNNYITYVFFLLFFIVGFNIYKDYGISIDEDNTRTNRFVRLKYLFEIFNYDYKSSLNSFPDINEFPQKGIGYVFDVPAALLEYVLETNDPRSSFLLRHLLNFIYFFIGLFLFVFQRQITFNKTSKPKKPEYYNLEEIKEIFIETYDNL